MVVSKLESASVALLQSEQSVRKTFFCQLAK